MSTTSVAKLNKGISASRIGAPGASIDQAMQEFNACLALQYRIEVKDDSDIARKQCEYGMILLAQRALNLWRYMGERDRSYADSLERFNGIGLIRYNPRMRLVEHTSMSINQAVQAEYRNVIFSFRLRYREDNWMVMYDVKSLTTPA